MKTKWLTPISFVVMSTVGVMAWALCSEPTLANDKIILNEGVRLIEVEASQLSRECDENLAIAAGKWDGKLLAVSGTIKSKGVRPRPHVVFDTGESDCEVICQFPFFDTIEAFEANPRFRQFMDAIEIGSTVTGKGFLSIEGKSMTIRKCSRQSKNW